MTDHIRTLLLNPKDGVPGYRHVSDQQVDAVLRLFGVTGEDTDSVAIDRVMPLALSPELGRFRDVFDSRVSPASPGSVYRDSGQDHGMASRGLYSSVLTGNGLSSVLQLFSSDDPATGERMYALRDAVLSHDACYALGAVLITCAYRRLLLQQEGE